MVSGVDDDRPFDDGRGVVVGFRRGLESVVADAVQACPKARNCKWIVGEYIPTPKNAYVSKLYEELGFARFDDGVAPDLLDPKGIAYRVAVDTFARREHRIRVHSLIV
mgnify:CR=1 FL=1